MLLLTVLMVPAAPASASKHDGDERSPVLFFASDGLRQDLVEKYAEAGRRSGIS